MAAASLSEIYKLLIEQNGKLGDLTGSTKAINEKVDELRSDMSDAEDASAQYRAGIREEIGKIVMRQTHLEADMSTVKAKVEAVQAVTDDVVQLRERAIGAGTLGRWLLAFGSALLGAVGGAAAVYTWITGRPPP